MITAEILCLGNELLIGRTVNKNATDIAYRLSKEGIQVTRVTTIRDEMSTGVNTLKEILSRKPNILCITGGLGPTHDDIQLDIVSNATNDSLEISEVALSMIAEFFDIPIEKITLERRKMAMIPSKGNPLKNRKGTAPGVITTFDNTTIFCLPGVPREMKSIFDKEVIPYIRDKFENGPKLVEYGVDVRGVAEADIRSITDQVMREYPDINFKSHPKKDESGYWLSLQVYQITEDSKTVFNAMQAWKTTIQDNFNSTKFTEIDNVFSDGFEPE